MMATRETKATVQWTAACTDKMVLTVEAAAELTIVPFSCGGAKILVKPVNPD